MWIVNSIYFLIIILGSLIWRTVPAAREKKRQGERQRATGKARQWTTGIDRERKGENKRDEGETEREGVTKKEKEEKVATVRDKEKQRKTGRDKNKQRKTAGEWKR